MHLQSRDQEEKHLLKLDEKNDFDCARKWVACDCTEAELARKETGNWVSTLAMWQSIVGSMFEKLEESSIFSVFYQPASASMKSARDISVMSTNLDARRTQQVSFMLLFSCLWPLMGSIQYVNNNWKHTHVSVCACLQQLHAWMVAMMMMIMLQFCTLWWNVVRWIQVLYWMNTALDSNCCCLLYMHKFVF